MHFSIQVNFENQDFSTLNTESSFCFLLSQTSSLSTTTLGPGSNIRFLEYCALLGRAHYSTKYRRYSLLDRIKFLYNVLTNIFWSAKYNLSYFSIDCKIYIVIIGLLMKKTPSLTGL